MVQVPLVIYQEGLPKRIGTAEVNVETGEVTADIQDPEMKELLTPDLTYYSVYAKKEPFTPIEVMPIPKLKRRADG